MLTLTDPRGIKFVTNTYDATGKVATQTLADGAVYRFTYGTGQTDVTDPRGIVRRVTFNSSGYAVSDTRALGRPEPASEDEVVLAFLKAEIDSPIWGPRYQQFLTNSGLTRDVLIHHADLGNTDAFPAAAV
jgi:YD repeat-containing protein